MSKCEFEIANHLNELGEKEVFCRWHSRWMNCDLGDCSEKCEHYKESIEENIEYIFRIGIDCFKGRYSNAYSWFIECKNKKSERDDWRVCRFGQAGCIERAFEKANLELKKLCGDN